jgi:alkylation response protein AidB-like acyl-CoA dehydrogenase
MRQRADVWSAAHHAAFTARDAVRAACDVAGSPSLYVKSPLERAIRDVQAVTQHIILKDAWLEDVGRVPLGLDPVVPMFAS